MYPEGKGSRRLAAAVPSRMDAMMPGMDGRDPGRQDGVGDAGVRGDRLDPDAAAVLIVDDRTENLKALEVFLEPLGNRIVTATSGRQALRLLDTEQFAVILLDVQMPEMDGFETAALVRAHVHTRSVPIIFLTGISASPEHVFRGYEAGAVDYIVKPVDPAILRSKVAVFVELFEKSREIARQSRLLQEQEQERLEREAAEQRHRRSRFAASVAAALERRLDVRGRAGQLAQTCIPELGDIALVQLVEPDGVVEVAAVATRVAQDDLLPRLVGTRSNLSSFGSWVFDDPRARLVEPVTPDTWRDLGLGNEGDLLCARLDLRSLIAAPLALGRRSLGVLVVCAVARDESYGDEELEIAKDVARKAAMAVDNSRLFEAEQERSKALQQSLLGRPEVASTAVAAAWRYLPGTAELEVGGDWYDLIERDDGRVLVAVGDVVGHGVQAATAMGKLRSAMGALGLVVDSVPELLGRLDQFAEKIEEARFGTVAAVQLQPETGELRYSLAGHPPPLVIDREGEARFLEGGAGLPLCLSLDGANGRPEGRAFLAEGSTLILYTDGLIERRADSIDSGLARLKNAAIARAGYEPERLCDEIVDEFAQGSLDDLVFLCLRREAGDSQIFNRVFPAVPKSLHTVRQDLRAWLGGQGVEERQIETIVQACGEGCANTVRHAYGEQPGEATLELRLRSNGRLVVRIRDSGRWRTEAHTESSGHGMEIMRALSEHVHIHRTPQGTTVVLEFDVRVPGPAADPRPREAAAMGD
jgi:serine phosphatase RsbU (regulator of sigma subunit)/CheY-like chemotaxis protein/anti-sigma regulatory factor (Ser/Thr protein kinase)